MPREYMNMEIREKAFITAAALNQKERIEQLKSKGG